MKLTSNKYNQLPDSIGLTIEQARQNAFDSDPLNRKQSGVRRYQVLHPIGNTNYVMVSLEFDTVQEAEQMQGALRRLWNQVEGRIMTDPKSRIFEIVESIALT